MFINLSPSNLRLTKSVKKTAMQYKEPVQLLEPGCFTGHKKVSFAGQVISYEFKLFIGDKYFTPEELVHECIRCGFSPEIEIIDVDHCMGWKNYRGNREHKRNFAKEVINLFHKNGYLVKLKSSMFINMSPQDTNVTKNTIIPIAQGVMEPVKLLEPGCFDADEKTIINRVSFIGHASSTALGGEGSRFTAEEFVNECLQCGFPKTIQIIDIYGCESGVKYGGKRSLAEEIARLFHGIGFSVKVNSFQHELSSKQGMVIFGSSHVVILNDREEWIKLLDKKESLENPRASIRSTIQTLPVLGSTFFGYTSTELEKKQAELLEIQYQMEALEIQIESHEHQSERCLRKILDEKIEYGILPPPSTHYSPIHSQAIRILTTEIARLQTLDNSSFSFYWKKPNHEIQILKKLLNTLRNNFELDSLSLIRLKNDLPPRNNIYICLSELIELLPQGAIELTDFKRQDRTELALT